MRSPVAVSVAVAEPAGTLGRADPHVVHGEPVGTDVVIGEQVCPVESANQALALHRPRPPSSELGTAPAVTALPAVLW